MTEMVGLLEFRVSLSMAFRLGPVLTVAVLIVPVLAGFIGVLLPAFGYFPALGSAALTLAPFRALFATPGLLRSSELMLFVGFVATVVSLFATMVLIAGSIGTPGLARLRRLLSPLLAIPHAALAFGLAFVVQPSGLIFRAFSPWATGLTTPPDLLIVNDPGGLALAAGLVLKETPFLFLMALAALPQVDTERSFVLARTLGYSPVAAFAKAVMPRLYPQLRLPVLAVLAYSLSVVDMSLILGPVAPPTLAIEILRLAHDPDLSRQLQAGAAAVLQLALVGFAIGMWLLLESAVAAAWRLWVAAGARQCCEASTRIAAPAFACLIGALAGLALVSLVLWSLATSWRFPDLVPAGFGFSTWRGELASALPLLGRSAAIAAVAVLVALLLTVLCLENEERRGRPSAKALSILYLPLLVPQIAFLTGLASLMIALRLDAGLLGVAFAHLVFVLPYVFLALSGPWRALDRRYRATALLLGAGPWRALLTVRLPLSAHAVFAAAAIGFAVSIGQYLPTLLIGAGRVTTITTEAVSLASGGDRRLIGVYALLQAALPLIGFASVVFIPALLFRKRKAPSNV